MAALSRGKRMLKRSLELTKTDQGCCKKKMMPIDDAKSWIEKGKDKDSFELKFISDYVGYGVFSKTQFEKGDFLLEYRGDLLSKKEALEIDSVHSKHGEGSFMFYFGRNNHCIDATEYSQYLGRMVNDCHGRKENCRMHLIQYKGSPHLCLFATRGVEPKDELVYDYGDKNCHWKKRQQRDNQPDHISDSDDDPFDLEYRPEKDDVSGPESDTSDMSSIIPNIGAFCKRTGTNSAEFPTTTGAVSMGTAVLEQEHRLRAEDDINEDNTPDSAEFPTTTGAVSMGTAVLEQEHRLRAEDDINEDNTPDSAEFPTTTGAVSMGTAVLEQEHRLRAEDDINEDNTPDSAEFPTTTGAVSMGTAVLEQEHRLRAEDDINEDNTPDSAEFPTTTGAVSMGTAVLEQEHRAEDDINEDNTPDSAEFPTTTGAVSMGTAVLEQEHRLRAEDDINEDNTPGLMCRVCGKKFKKRGGLVMHEKSHEERKEKYKKPLRRCIFCNGYYEKLKRHVVCAHEDKVGNTDILGKEEERQVFKDIRNKGIYKENKEQCLKENPIYQTSKACGGETVFCQKCSSFYSKKNYYRHREKCQMDKAVYLKPVDSNCLVSSASDDDFNTVLQSLRADDVGSLCRSDKTIKAIGRRLWEKDRTKVDKTMEVKNSVKGSMRIIGRLYLEFKNFEPNSECVLDMFNRYKFKALREAVRSICEKGDGKGDVPFKYGLKDNIYYTLVKAAEILRDSFLETEGCDGQATEMENFLKVLKLNQNLVFGDAKYQINKSRQERLRLPNRTPEENHVSVLRTYTLKIIKQYTEYDTLGKHDFVKLRTCVNSRLTLFNARRGGEPSRLKISDWINRDKWVSEKQKLTMSEMEMQLFKKMQVVFQTGKGNHLVSCFVPEDCEIGMNLLCDEENRKSAQVAEKNDFVFANTEYSLNHTIGWNATNALLMEVELPRSLNATSNRCRISTLYAGLDLPEADRERFFSHLGHSKEVNKGVYQRPLPVLALTKVGKILNQFDQDSAEFPTTTGAVSMGTAVLEQEHRLRAEDDINEDNTPDSAEFPTTTGAVSMGTAVLEQEHRLRAEDDINEDNTPDSAEFPTTTGAVSMGTAVLEQEHRLRAEDDINEDNTPDSTEFHTGSMEAVQVEKNITEDDDKGEDSFPGAVVTVLGHSEVPKHKTRAASFQWSREKEATKKVLQDFKKWIEIDDGNPLQSKAVRIKYLETNSIGCTEGQLRNKIMNEQNKRRKIIKQRLIMCEKL